MFINLITIEKLIGKERASCALIVYLIKLLEIRMTIKYKYRILFLFKTIDFNDRYDLYMYDW